MSKYTHLFFDLDNTIFDFNASSKLAFSALLKSYDIEEESDHYEVYKKINAEVWSELEKRLIDQKELKRKRFQLFFDYIKFEGDGYVANQRYLEYLVEFPAYVDHAITLIEDLAQDYTLVAATNGLTQVQYPRLSNGGLEKYFEAIIVSEEIKVAKPHKGFFEQCFAKSGNPDKSDVLMIGDSLQSDIQGGIIYNIDTCWFNPHKNPNHLNLKPTYEITDLKETYNLLKEEI
jgi:putative hydrolase of the HAD superfamily